MNPYIKGAQLGWKLGHYLTCGQWTYSCKLAKMVKIKLELKPSYQK
jgi:hypothetical protein